MNLAAGTGKSTINTLVLLYKAVGNAAAATFHLDRAA
jgi:hypothetical protein